MTSPQMRILISRIDNIGDVLFSFPLATLLKLHYPDSQIFYLARPYVRAIVELCPDVAGFIDSDMLLQQPLPQAAAQLSDYKFDVFINADATRLTARLAKAAGIKLRIGTSHRWYHWWYCNRLVHFSRARSGLHEAELNLKLFRGLNKQDCQQVSLIPKLTAPAPLPAHLADYIDPQRFNLIIHPGSNGNGKEWPVAFYCELIARLPPAEFNVLLTGTQQERERFQAALLEPCAARVTDVMGKMNLTELLSFIAAADGLLASGTGPLHLAAALGRYALGLFPDYPTSGVVRWHPQGKHAHYLFAPQACTPACQGGACTCMHSISVDAVLQQLQQFYVSSHKENP